MGSAEENRKLLRKAEKLGDSLSLACFLSSGSGKGEVCVASAD